MMPGHANNLRVGMIAESLKLANGQEMIGHSAEELNGALARHANDSQRILNFVSPDTLSVLTIMSSLSSVSKNLIFQLAVQKNLVLFSSRRVTAGLPRLTRDLTSQVSCDPFYCQDALCRP